MVKPESIDSLRNTWDVVLQLNPGGVDLSLNPQHPTQVK